jgi:DNA-binding response OmpR family regulator
LAHVLVVEDDVSMRTLLSKQLTSNGFEVTVADDGLDALVRLESFLPDLIICDVNMPKLDGFAFVEAIKRNQRTRDIPVMFLTASTDEKQHKLGLKVGARYYMTKPFSMQELLWKVRRLLERPQ